MERRRQRGIENAGTSTGKRQQDERLKREQQQERKLERECVKEGQ
jgi:hypothetical protein